LIDKERFPEQMAKPTVQGPGWRAALQHLGHLARQTPGGNKHSLFLSSTHAEHIREEVTKDTGGLSSLNNTLL